MPCRVGGGGRERNGIRCHCRDGTRNGTEAIIHKSIFNMGNSCNSDLEKLRISYLLTLRLLSCKIHFSLKLQFSFIDSKYSLDRKCG